MKVSRSFIGKYVEVKWRDPGTSHTKGRKREDIPRGIEALASWAERGVIDDLTEGVVRIVHSEGRAPQHIDGVDELELSCTWVPEDLIEGIIVYEPVKSSEEK